MSRTPEAIVDAALPPRDTIYSRTAVRRLFEAIVDAWQADTSADPDNWSPGSPAYGQCAVTALIVQERLGGSLRRTTVGAVSHYYNRLRDGTIVDLTASQFDPDAERGEVIDRERAYVMSFPETAARYELLRRRVIERVGP